MSNKYSNVASSTGTVQRSRPRLTDGTEGCSFMFMSLSTKASFFFLLLLLFSSQRANLPISARKLEVRSDPITSDGLTSVQ